MRDFVDAPYIIHKRDPHWVPPLRRDTRATLNRTKNPFFSHGESEYYVARDISLPVGRIAAIIDHDYNKRHGTKIGWFGFFESVDDDDVARGLLRAACGWLRDKGMTEVYGPASPAMGEDGGFPLDGDGSMSHYHRMMEANGFVKAKDLCTWRLNASAGLPEGLTKLGVAVSIVNPEMGRALKKMRGRILPFGWLWQLYYSSKSAGAELSWTLEDDKATNESMAAMGAKLYRKCRVYKKGLLSG